MADKDIEPGDYGWFQEPPGNEFFGRTEVHRTTVEQLVELVTGGQAYGGIYLAGGAPAQGGLTAVPVQLLGFAGVMAGPLNCTPAIPTSSLTIGLDGAYQFFGNFCYTGIIGANYRIELYKNGAPVFSFADAVMGPASQTQHIGFSWIDSACVIGDFFQPFVSTPAPSTGITITMIDAQFQCSRMGT